MPPVTAADFSDAGNRLQRMASRDGTQKPVNDMLLTSWSHYVGPSPAQLTAAFCDGWPDGITAQLDYDLDTSGMLRLLPRLFQNGEQIARMSLYLFPEDGSGEFQLIRVENAQQGQGLGRHLVKRMADVLQQMKIDKLSLSAELEAGGYVWARFGFLPKHELAWTYLKKSVAERWETLKADQPAATVAVVDAALASDKPEALWLLADQAGKTADGVPLGRALLAGTEWKGTLDLADPAQKTRFAAALPQATVAPVQKPTQTRGIAP